ncbi:isochorismatase family protein [Azorhizobium doebereinerae]|uniref:isochorismatase family protein n=1 Tax=Azorhizobium doebereinerae TaxID=281091 RepID=UPI00041CC61A|nr:isochorismatase family protein [Azorhizobium doebereinerae]
MLTMDASTAMLLVIDIQAKLMPAIDQSAAILANARRLVDAAALLGVPMLFTEQNAKGIGPTVPELVPPPALLVHKMAFDACREPAFQARLPEGRAIVVAGCEAHVCVLQTTLGLLERGRKVFLVRDAVGARRAENKDAALRRMERHGAEIVTTEMVVFEWLGSADHPRFREALALVK